VSYVIERNRAMTGLRYLSSCKATTRLTMPAAQCLQLHTSLLLPFQAPISCRNPPTSRRFRIFREEIAPLSASRVHVVRSNGAEFAFRHLHLETTMSV
jgi:hypothetical protein